MLFVFFKRFISFAVAICLYVHITFDSDSLFLCNLENTVVHFNNGGLVHEHNVMELHDMRLVQLLCGQLEQLCARGAHDERQR